MRRLIYLKDAAVVKINDVDDLDEDFDKNQDVDFDTIVEDKTKTYSLGETYVVDEFLQRNNIHPNKGLISIERSCGIAQKYIEDYLNKLSMLLVPVLISANSQVGIDVLNWVDSVVSKYQAEEAAVNADPDHTASTNYNSCGDCPYTNAEIKAAYDAL